MNETVTTEFVIQNSKVLGDVLLYTELKKTLSPSQRKFLAGLCGKKGIPKREWKEDTSYMEERTQLKELVLLFIYFYK